MPKKVDTAFLRDVIAAAKIEHKHFKGTPKPISWSTAMCFAWESVRETRKLDALFAELAI